MVNSDSAGMQQEPDQRVMDLDLNELGWVGTDRDAPEVEALRRHLAENSGIDGLEVVDPGEVDRAVRLFRRDGFVVVRDVLLPEQLEFLRSGCDREIRRIVAHDRQRVGNRGSHRYSFGGASLTGQLLHHPEWAMLADLPGVTPILSAIFESENYHLRGGGGDFCLPGAVEYQRLHADMGDRRLHRSYGGREREVGSFHDPAGQHSIRDLPVPYVCCNFLTVDFTTQNGPTRQIPGTQNSRQPIPKRDEEPEWMRLSTVCPATAGSVLMRDVRAWHGGTPNVSDEVRAIPNAEFFAPWFREVPSISMPRKLHDTLSDHGRRVSRALVALDDDEVEFGLRSDLGY